MEKHVLKYQELNEDGTRGREIVLADIAFTPMGYAALRDAKLHQPIKIPLIGCGTVVGSDVVGIETGQNVKFNATLESEFTSRAIGLVQGGWLPSALAAVNDTVVLPDRCVVAQLNARLKNGATKPAAEKDFIDLFADSAIRINPLLFALEGDGRQDPTPDTIGHQLEEAMTKLRSALPKAEMVAADAKGFTGILGLIRDAQEGMARNQDFLVRLNPKFAASIGRADRQARWDEVLATAQACGISNSSLVVVAALSAILVPNGGGPARRLLKFRQGYTRELAYNALADLRSLEILMHIFGLFPNQNVMLCTADKDMALFWAGLSASNFAFSTGRLTYDLRPIDLMPDVTEKQWKMFIGR